ncbi:MAG: hypothetical protein ACYDBB_19360 [Armatimonadota bacterium]
MKSLLSVLLITLWCLCPVVCIAQHDHAMPPPTPPQGNRETMPAPHDHGVTPMEEMPMDMVASPIGIPMARDGAGTSWLPDSTPMYAFMRQSGKWHLMYHGAAHLAYDVMNGPRGDTKLILPNWAMLMAHRNVGMRNQWRLAAMLSLDPVTVGGSGYPLLFQTGETWNDEPLIDHQHPHNFFTELSAKYTRALNPNQAVYLYAAPVGQPALGPVAYMHRTFALDNPLAPIGHHWQDATHIAFGVVTGGYQTRTWQVEASTFNGREPGENRFEIKKPTFDSFSTRVSYNPSPSWALQTSYAFLKSPEALHPEDDAHRTEISAIYNRPLSAARNFQTTLLWGRNAIDGLDLDSYLVEAQLKQDGGWTPYLRVEYIRKNAEELVLSPPFPEDQVFNLRQMTIGASRDLPIRGDYQWGIGAQWIVSFTPDALEPIYGKNPTGWLFYIRVHPGRMEQSD